MSYLEPLERAKRWNHWNQAASLLLAALMAFAPSIALAHPGGVDKTGCHTVAKNYTYASGVIAKRGENHCHRGVGKMKFDGKEVLKSVEELQQEKPTKGKSK